MLQVLCWTPMHSYKSRVDIKTKELSETIHYQLNGTKLNAD